MGEDHATAQCSRGCMEMLHRALKMGVHAQFGWHKGDLPVEQLFEGSLA
jgi:hypothetical protein